MTDDTVIIDQSADGVHRLSLNRPERRNAFDPAMTEALAAAIQSALASPDCRVLVIRGVGGTFSAGRDLGTVTDLNRDDILARDEKWVAIYKLLHRARVPSVAVVEGFAVAGGFTLAMGCDFVLADRNAEFGALEMRNGFPAAVCTPLLARLLGPRLGLELALFGKRVKASRLYEMGLINDLADGSEELSALEASFCGHLAGLAPDAVAYTRESFRAAEYMPLDNALDMGKQLNQLLGTGGWFAAAGARYAKPKITEN